MNPLKEVWLFTVDQKRGVLWHGRRAPERRYHFDAVDTIPCHWEEHQHRRPSPLAAKNGHTHASYRHELETLRHRFAKDVSRWLLEQIERRDIETVHLFAPPRFLGEVRRCVPARLARRLTEHAGDLGSLRAGELVRHPVVAALIGVESAT